MTDDVMDDELLAPPSSDIVPDESTDEAESDVEAWRFSHGFTDARQVVRIWVDEDTRHLERVKLSARWRERLAGHSLSDAFFEAFFCANLRFGQSRNLEVPEPEPVEVEFEGTHEDLEEQYLDLMDRIRELDARAPENVRWADFEGEKVRASGRDGNVTVTLSLAGLTEKVEFNKSWLASAGASEIADQVLKVHRKAYDSYVPPVFVPGEREELAEECRKLSAALQSKMSKGIA